MGLPAHYDEVPGLVPKQDVVLDLSVLRSPSETKTHVPVSRSVKRVPGRVNARLPRGHGPAPVLLGALVDLLKECVRTRAEAAARGESNRDELGIALIIFNNRGDICFLASLALTGTKDGQAGIKTCEDSRARDRSLRDCNSSDFKRNAAARQQVEEHDVEVKVATTTMECYCLCSSQPSFIWTT